MTIVFSAVFSASFHLIGFVIASEPAADLVYVTGDTVWFTGTADVARRFAPSVVLLALRRCGEQEGPFI